MKVWLNGKPAEIAEGTVDAALELLDLESTDGIALAVDGEVLPKSGWNDVRISAGQRIEVVRAVQGG